MTVVILKCKENTPKELIAVFGLYAQFMSELDKNNFVKIPHSSPEHLEVVEKIKDSLRGLKITYEVSRVGNLTIIEILP